MVKVYNYWLLKQVKYYIFTNKAGAVTIDFVVLSAAVVLIAVSAGVTLSGKVKNSLDNIELSIAVSNNQQPKTR